MNHLMKLILVSAVPLVAIVSAALAASASNTAIQVNSTVHQYLAGGPTSVSYDAGIGQVVRAAQPWNFQSAMSKATYGSGLHFHVSQVFDPAYGNSSRAMPYPPRDVWCVSLSDASGRGQIVFAALHEDMYSADWVVHEPAAERGTPRMGEWLSSIGCAFSAGD